MDGISRRHWILGLPGWIAALPARARPARATGDPPPALQLARDAPPGIDPAGHLVSEKLDGARAAWDGRRLRLRGGGDVAAPAWFLAALPAEPLDGELWSGRGEFERLVSTVRSRRPDDAAWRRVRYAVFDQPGTPGPFAQRAARLAACVARQPDGPLLAVVQATLADRAALRARLQAVLALGGEGLVLHRADAAWAAGRSGALLKLKPVQDDEALVIGHRAGRGRHAGRVGALQVRAPDGRTFWLGSGLSDAQRDAPPPIGSVVTYAYRGTTAQGLPRFASFLRLAPP